MIVNTKYFIVKTGEEGGNKSEHGKDYDNYDYELYGDPTYNYDDTSRFIGISVVEYFGYLTLHSCWKFVHVVI